MVPENEANQPSGNAGDGGRVYHSPNGNMLQLHAKTQDRVHPKNPSPGAPAKPDRGCVNGGHKLYQMAA